VNVDALRAIYASIFTLTQEKSSLIEGIVDVNQHYLCVSQRVKKFRSL